MRSSSPAIFLSLGFLLTLLAGVSPAEEGNGVVAARTYPATPPLPADVDSHRNIAGLYLINVPQGWQAVRQARVGYNRTVFTPFEGVRPRQDPPVGLAVSYEFFQKGQSLLDLPIGELGPRLVQYLLYDFPRLRETPDHRRASESAAVSYFTTAIAGQLRDCDDEVVGKVLFARSENLLYTIMAWCRATDQASHLPALERIVGDFIPSPRERHQTDREKEPLQPFDLAKKYKASVVMIRSISGDLMATGSGFLVREDGYILTNHHVVWDEARGVPHDDISVHWDQSLELPSRPARIVAAFRGKESTILDRCTIDVALLKIDGRGYEPMPLTPVSAVELGDPVMTMGYPMSTIFRDVSIFVTNGSLTRINRLTDGRTNSFYIDAKFTHGNSGGPAIDRMTGGVFGINTFVIGEGTKDAFNLYGYNGVIPIDHALEKFPQIVCYPAGALDAMDAEDHRELGFAFLAQGRDSAASTEFQEAIRLEPGNAVAHVGQAECEWMGGTGDPWQTLTKAEGLVQDDREEMEVLELMAAVYLGAGMAEKCVATCDRILRHFPERWAPYTWRGRARAKLGQKDLAYEDLARARQYLMDLLPDAYVESGRMAIELGDLEVAKGLLTEAVAKFPVSGEAHVELAECLARAGRLDEALAALEAKAQEFRKSPAFQARYGALLVQAGRSDEAADAYDWAMNLYTDVEGKVPFDVAEAAGWLHLDRGEYQFAFDAFTCALLEDSTSPRAASVFAGLGETLTGSKSGQGIGWAHLARARELAPEDSKVKEAAATIPQEDLPLESVDKLLFTLAYPPQVVVDLIKAARPTYRVTEEQAEKMIEEGIPPVVVEALLEASPKADTPADHWEDK